MNELVKRLTGHRVLIVGDVMLDEYIWGEVSRISPEAPVPIVHTRRRTYRPGGAGNVAANVAALGGVPLLAGVTGCDYFAGQLLEAMRGSGLTQLDGLVQHDERTTTVKTRIVAHNQQMLRLDSENAEPISSEIATRLLDWCMQHIETASVCILSDYAKGVVTPHLAKSFIQLARSRNLPVIVDPKGRDYARYRGATLVTPNVTEAALAVEHLSRDAWNLEQTAEQLLRVIGGGNLLITQGAHGMALYRDGMSCLHISAHARNVYDVSGAGDTVVATLALALAAGAELEQAARLANLSAGLVVSKFGIATVTVDELLQELGAP